MNDLIYEILKAAVGAGESLSRIPSEAEWKELFDIAVRQFLPGVCNAGLHKLGADVENGFSHIGISDDLYMNWIGLTYRITVKNETVNSQCVKIQSMLSGQGISNCILKGQGVASYYSDDLRPVRQSGDIDVFVDCGMGRAVSYVRTISPTNHINHKHIQLNCFEDTPVEVHYVAAELHCPWQNHHLQKFFANHKGTEHVSLGKAGKITIPCYSFNIVHLMSHTYRHLFGDGIVLRQVMDLYFLLLNMPDGFDCQDVAAVIRKTGMIRFASAMTWVLERVFGLDVTGLPWSPDPDNGSFLLDEIMNSGTPGYHDNRKGGKGETHWHRFWRVTRENLRLFRFSPWEVICTPLWRIWHFIWMRCHGYTQG